MDPKIKIVQIIKVLQRNWISFKLIHNSIAKRTKKKKYWEWWEYKCITFRPSSNEYGGRRQSTIRINRFFFWFFPLFSFLVLLWEIIELIKLQLIVGWFFGCSRKGQTTIKLIFYVYNSKRNFFGCSSDHLYLDVEPQLVGRDNNRISYTRGTTWATKF